MYFNEGYNICLKYFSKSSIFLKINAKTPDFHGFYHENRQDNFSVLQNIILKI